MSNERLERLAEAGSALMFLISYWPVLLGCFAAFALINAVLFLRRRVKKPFLNPEEFQPLTLAEKRYITHNTVRMRFDLPDTDQRLGLPIGQHITFKAQDPEGKDVFRPYTPTTDDDTLGSVEFVIKLYPQGKMSQILKELKVGDSLLMKGPKGRFQYTPNMKNHIGMLAGGSGITPMYQVLNAILKNPDDKTNVSLIFGNITESDILLRNELDDLAKMHANRFKVYYVLNETPEGWTGGKGFITDAMIRRHLPEPGPNTLVLRCGPLPMMTAMKEILDKLGYAEESQFQF